ncbi:MAG: hypothetical protein AB7O24_06750 [Kofleriaceae bacterium]
MPMSPRCVRHLNRCSRCAQFAERLTALDRRLAGGAMFAPLPLVMPRPAIAVRWVAAGLLAAVAAVATVGYLIGDASHSPSIPNPPAIASFPTAPSQAGSVEHDAVPRTAQVMERISEALRAPPLRGELAALGTDGLRGARAVLQTGGLIALLPGSNDNNNAP